MKSSDKRTVVFNFFSKNKDKPEKALICITTCNRPEWVKKLAPAYIDFWKNNLDRYQFLLAIDGKEDETIAWAEENQIPYMYAEERKGVSMSKNRVIQNFWGYDYYFFIDDDVELIDGRVFNEHIEAYKKTGIHHFNLGPDERFYYRKKIVKVNGYIVTQSYIGTGCFLFYSRKALSIVGYYHPIFGEYKRYGHTEHSFRAFRNKLAPSPFCKIDNLENFIDLKWPVSVTKHKNEIGIKFGIALVEKKIIDDEIYHISDYGGGRVRIKNIDNIPLLKMNRARSLIKEFGIFNGISLLLNKKLNYLRILKRKLGGTKKTGNSFNF